ncbi:ImmA/IrrE family metallo-endopeptidase [Desulfovibrio sp. JY]|nr:ImmA/IrrE family metallo-endopeptidase [Desulfovibrio sp. JY]
MNSLADARVVAVPGLSWAEVQKSARDLLELVCPERLNSPGPTPVAELFEGGLREVLGVEYRIDDLYDGEAEYDPKKRELTLDEGVYLGLLDENGRDRFTVAHEIGHAHLHGPYYRGVIRGKRKAIVLQRSQVPVYQNPEKQADVYASELLMPSPLVAQMIRDDASLIDLSRTFKVSHDAARVKQERVLRSMRAGKL